MNADFVQKGLGSVLLLKDSQYERTNVSEQTYGSGGQRTYQFRVIGSGRGTLDLFLARSYELAQNANLGGLTTIRIPIQASSGYALVMSSVLLALVSMVNLV